MLDFVNGLISEARRPQQQASYAALPSFIAGGLVGPPIWEKSKVKPGAYSDTCWLPPPSWIRLGRTIVMAGLGPAIHAASPQ
jgi:hypothetical protein